jgi:hypothetical protein
VGRWTNLRSIQSALVSFFARLARCLVQTTLVMTEAEKQLRHANEQLVLAGAYPGRERARPRGKVIEM